eukprot:CAMPEP_0171251108 /NCGR_PEP_ID=MMETSP0790-20130122/50463_1 /TAXON_ID=2925 /ORGANISM="Alexandrium catenella, Strain OF101" /LENGTH=62 /DNA_ID=CAMNT_0011718783 /DNA_START=21 /DNA_END=206 /DNA_ORIENTATION=+
MATVLPTAQRAQKQRNRRLPPCPTPNATPPLLERAPGSSRSAGLQGKTVEGQKRRKRRAALK